METAETTQKLRTISKLTVLQELGQLYLAGHIDKTFLTEQAQFITDDQEELSKFLENVDPVEG